MKRLALFLAALPAFAQTITVPSGTASDPAVGGYPWTSPAISAQPAPWNAMRASATTISYDLPAPVGTCTVILQFIEPRSAGPDPATQSSVGARLFTVSANGSAPVTVDIFAAKGALTPYRLPLATVPAVDAHLRLLLTAIKGNAIISGFTAICMPTPAAPFTLNPDGSWTFAGSLRVTGTLDIGKQGTPTHFAVTQADGSPCDLSFMGGKISLTC